MTTLKIPGERIDSDAPTIGSDKVFTTQVRADIRLDTARAAAENVVLKDVADDEVLELELEGGLRLWLSVEQFRKDFPGVQVRGGEADSDELTIVRELPLGPPSRGIGEWILKGLRVLKIDPVDTAAGLSAAKLAEKIEERLEPVPGLFLLENSVELKPDNKVEAELPASDKPFLILLHGTASSTKGSFSGLWEHKDWQQLLRDHQGHAYALQHRSLSQSPVDNALEIVSLLPKHAKLHLVSHSRGGLIGELLCRAGAIGGQPPFEDELVKNLFSGSRYADERQKIEQLNALLIDKQPRVERFVRVACPARGTTLASERLDRYLSVLFNLVSKIPGFDNVVLDLLGDFLLAVVKKRTDPRDLPGLEAMMPKSALVHLLNRPDTTVNADLSVIAGDIEGEGIWSRLKVLATDLFYQADHDLVVNTEAMYGGTGRNNGARYHFEQGPEVNHFSYFRNADSARYVIAGLRRQEGDNAGFKPYTRPQDLSRGWFSSRTKKPRPVVFVLPGITGSHLTIGNNRIWLDPVSLGFGGLKKIAIKAKNVEAEALVGLAYHDLVNFLEDSHEVVRFPYDWRLSLQKEAERLAAAVREQLQRTTLPVRILAHSMGGLLARVMFAQDDALWQQLRQREGFRFVMLGTPNSGSHSIVRLLLGRERTIKYLALLDLKHNQEELLAILTRYPGVLELLPSIGERDYFKPPIWQELKTAQTDGWTLPQESDLNTAAKTWQLIKQSPLDPERVFYIAGQADLTTEQLRFNNGQIEFIGTARGDGQVPWAGGIPAGLKVWYMRDVVHGDLAKHRPAFEALQELLETGATNRLPTTAPATRGLAEGIVLPPEDEVERFPNERDLVAAALGGSASWSRRPQRTEPLIDVEVAHGDLAYAKYPVMAGHYQGDSIVSAEKALDDHLQGRLRERHRLGYYPGPVETAEVVLNPDAERSGLALKGAVIIGLGAVGKLSYGELTASVTRGALKYAVAVSECRPSNKRASAPLSCLLISTGAGGLLVEDALPAILRGIVHANHALNESGLGARVRIDKVQFIELYEDRALTAAHVLQQIDRDSELRNRFAVTEQLKSLPGKRFRVRFEESQGWWQRLQILGRKDGSLRYTTLTTQLGRADVRLQATQTALLDQFIEQAIQNSRSDLNIAKTLFELLIPNTLKNYSQARYDLMLVLNDASAAYPWELLQDRYDADAKPLAVKSGVLRQLTTRTFREGPRAPVGNAVLVVGDPPSRFVELPGAKQEAEHVTKQFERSSFEVTELIRKDARQIITALFARGYRVLHLAGHGVYEYPVPGDSANRPAKTVSGMVLGHDIFLTPIEVEQMREVPELVFINCCHLGRIEAENPDLDDPTRRNRHRLAANLATQLIRMGVRAVVAAGWAVDDAAAETFARVFYDRMLDGETFGRAVLHARQETYQNHSGVNTWGAYQCYGDPDYVLTQYRRTENDQSKANYVSPSEVRVDLDDLASQACCASDERISTLLQRVQAIEGQLPEHWKTRSDVQEALGRVYGELYEFEKAVGCYQAAIDSGDDVSTKAIEQRANLLGRWAIQTWLMAQANEDQEASENAISAANTQINDAINELKTLCQLAGNSVERLSLLGSAYKRRALISNSPITSLRNMARFYKEAHELALETKGTINHYPLLNWLAAELVLQRRGLDSKTAPDDFTRLIGQAEQIADAKDREEPNFWNGTIKPECELVHGLTENALDVRQEAIVKGYLAARQRGVSTREFSSVIEHLDFLIEMLSGQAKLCTALKWIKSRL